MTATTYAPSATIARRVAARLNAKLSPTSRKRIRYAPGRYRAFNDLFPCVRRSVKTRAGWIPTGVVARINWGDRQ